MPQAAIVPIDHKLPEPADKQPKRFRIGKKLQVAIDAIVFEGADLQAAAKTAKTSTRVLRRALERRHVLAHLKRRREVLRASARGSNISRLVQIRDAADNMPAVQAIRELERMDDGDEIAAAARRSPGVVIIVQGGAVNASLTDVAAKPLTIQRDIDEE